MARFRLDLAGLVWAGLIWTELIRPGREVVAPTQVDTHGDGTRWDGRTHPRENAGIMPYVQVGKPNQPKPPTTGMERAGLATDLGSWAPGLCDWGW